MNNSKPSVQILMSTYNGEKYLGTQLDSLFNQKDVNVSLLVRDDGSSDNTTSIIEDYAKENPIKLIRGNNKGYANSFWELVQKAEDSDYYAFCDQDDFWCEDKLMAAIKMISDKGNVPVLYTSNVDTVDDALNLITHNAFPVTDVQNFNQSLLTSILPGCTFVFNKELLPYLKQYKGLVISHDWLVYIIAAGVGIVLFDDKPHIKYRIHGNNVLGIQSPIKKLKVQIHNFFYPKYPNGRSVVSRNIYESFGADLSEEDAKVARLFGYYKSQYRNIWSLLKYDEFRDFILDVLLLLKKA